MKFASILHRHAWMHTGMMAFFVAALACGCSSGHVEPRKAGLRPSTGGSSPLATTSAKPSAADRRRRLIPEVIAKPKPFQLSDAAVQPASPLATSGEPGRRATIPASHAEPAQIAMPSGSSRPLAGRDRSAAHDESNPTVTEIRGMMRSYLRAFNRHDSAALAAHWSDTGENVDLDSGEVTAAGRQAVRDVFATLFETDDAATIDIDVQSIRPLRDDIAVVDGVSLISFADGQPASSRFSAVVVKQDGRWVLENVRESARPVAAGGPSRPLDDLAWLVGSWEDVGEGVTAGSQCSWSSGRGFLIRSHVVTADDVPEHRPAAGDDRIPGLLPAADGKPREMTEIIGWDPDRRGIRSWIFTSDGRFGEGSWSRDGDSWTVQVEGRGRDEGLSGSCTLTPDGPDGVTIRCVGDRLLGILPPACGFSRTAR